MEDEKIDKELLEQRREQIKPWQFKKGQSGNPKGRPPGKSLKERAKAMLNAMSEEEEQEFFAGMDKRTIWEMAEGKAKQDTDITSNGKTITVVVPQAVAESFNINESNQETGGSDKEQVTIQGTELGS